MKTPTFLLSFLLFPGLFVSLVAGETASSDPLTKALPGKDWLIDPSSYRASVNRSVDGREVVLENGLVRRVLRLTPNAATVAYDNSITGQSILRSVRPEAVVEIDGRKYNVGGLSGQPVHNYLDPRWIERLKADPNTFQFQSIKIGKTRERFPWKKRPEWMPHDLPWPPPGAALAISFAAPRTPASRPAKPFHRSRLRSKFIMRSMTGCR